ncbi:conjugal transfer protein TraW [Symbiopectobacterium purcellii]|uniref:Conjugal transfer protein TraW n=1 Tax=Symbiopectobacterium purcellii TaxID=2871826 RepID=A0ABX9AQ03_9ENTR|nr:conjugal transfer protein TraW [Symbiopectobacterium purcellii]QZN96704.1 conjugal transfer protein TraW [Symbiopectobacterium purcellii]
MRIRKKILAVIMFCGVATGTWAAMPVTDGTLITVVKVGFNAIATQIASFQLQMVNYLTQIGSAINQNGSKVSTTIEAAAKAEREFSTEKSRQEKIQEAKAKYQVANSICSESASGGAVSVSSGSASAKSALRPGGTAIASKVLNAAVNKPSLSSSDDAARAANIHAGYCDSFDYEAFGGSQACLSVNSAMPGADKRIDSILSGAGKEGKAPDLTFTQEQTDVARMYVQNSVRRSVSKDLTKAEANSNAGVQYIGMKTQMNASLSAAADAQERVLSERQPLDITKQLLTEALLSPSAKTYFDATASDVAKSTGKMSKAEFLQFEVGRRYSNTEYQKDLQAMDTANLAREQINVASLTNWLLLELRNEIQVGNIIAGQHLASRVRAEYEPLLNEQFQAIGARAGGE